MTAGRRRLIVAACVLIAAAATAVALNWIGPAAIIMTADLAPGKRPAESKHSAHAKTEAKILAVLDDLYSEEYPMTNVPLEDGRLLRILAETTGAKKVVEIGTSNGCSALWFCLALRTTGGTLITHEIDDYRVSLARDNFKRAGVDKIVTIVEGDAHKTITNIKGPIDILFLDADKTGYLDYLNRLLPLVRPGGLILAHNTTDRAAEMQDYINAVTTNPDLETIFLHKEPPGLALTLKKRQTDSSQN